MVLKYFSNLITKTWQCDHYPQKWSMSLPGIWFKLFPQTQKNISTVSYISHSNNNKELWHKWPALCIGIYFTQAANYKHQEDYIPSWLQVGEPVLIFPSSPNWLVDQKANSALEELRTDRGSLRAPEEVTHEPHMSALLLANSPSPTGEPTIPFTLPVAKVLCALSPQ